MPIGERTDGRTDGLGAPGQEATVAKTKQIQVGRRGPGRGDNNCLMDDMSGCCADNVAPGKTRSARLRLRRGRPDLFELVRRSTATATATAAVATIAAAAAAAD